MIVLKSAREIGLMRAAGRVVAEALALARRMIEPGVRTRDIDRAVEELFEERGAQSLFKGYPGKVPFPAVCCISVNEEVVHGIPSDRVLQDGDIISVDTGCRLNGWCGDSAWTFPVGEVDDEKERLLEVGQSVLQNAIGAMGRMSKWSEVARSMEAEVHRAGFSVVEDLVGHGIGREMHEDPQVPNFPAPSLLRHDFRIEAGLVLAVEPMINAGTRRTRVSRADHWTITTRDGRPSVHFEHTIAMTPEGPTVLTTLEGDDFPRKSPSV